MRIGLFFGSFNPIHNGHLIIGSYIVNNFDLEQVWFIVSPQNPFKSTSLLNEFSRLYLAKISIEGEKNLKISDVEFHLPRPSYTIDTLIYLSEKYPSHEFVIILGSDSYENLPKWKNFNILKEKYSFLVYKRTGFTGTKTWNDKTVFVNAPFLDISATLIRKLIQEGKSIRYYVPDNVKEEIEKSGYYKFPSKKKTKKETN